MANVRKHARASSVRVELSAADGIILVVTDDGVGFPHDVESATARGYGLSGMASRLALADGGLSITTGAWGTQVHIRLREAPATQEEPS
ncbi:sensor histidine kinase [Acidipropionibacterium virtanenii]|uniref:Sensor histidine kinase ComP n=1 Tax=Acidipropionibacterium virtanenii TaxID=2057246 RepID=A0A344UPP9_9ACTN|nr:ATP-binding protein [Acidipropionibacterium virtanenii]AXE37247.1 Sensor histidine kinase ComP [Acidipropionibacterium virtanenii]